MSGALEGLPDAFAALLGDLPDRLGDEPLATCGDCAMKPRPGVPEDVPWAPVFTAAARCCTYHPHLPAFLAGRALRRGGPGAARIRARLAEPDGVTAGGIRPSARHRAAYADGGGFGHEQRLTCPFWSAEAPEGRGCTIHADREAVCRTWHCRRGAAGRSHAAWMALKELLVCVEATLAETVPGGPGPGRSPEDWEAWYVRCADRVDALGPDDLAGLRGERLDKLKARLAARLAERDAEMPDVVIPTLRNWVVHDNGITLSTWSAYDPVEAPRWLFELLSRLDGRTPWREAKAGTETALGISIEDDLVVHLYRRGALGPPEYVDVMPGLTVVPTP